MGAGGQDTGWRAPQRQPAETAVQPKQQPMNGVLPAPRTGNRQGLDQRARAHDKSPMEEKTLPSSSVFARVREILAAKVRISISGLQC